MLPIFTVLLVCGQTGYSDNFNTLTWGKFEEPINACYATNAGAISIQNNALRVAANQGGTLLSNHVIAQKQLNTTGSNGRFTYKVDFYIDADLNDNLTFPQTGPEISVQNTRNVNGTFVTNTMALQYVANPWVTGNKWNVWTETSPGVANWVSFSGPVLTPRTWYSLTLKANMDTGAYTSATLCQGSNCQLLTVAGLAIADEIKWPSGGLWLTLETENLWQSQCGGSGALPLVGVTLYDTLRFTIR